jgi:large subunit ribosomal protein L4
MELKLINDKGEAAGNHAASDALFGREYNEALVHQVVVAFQANARSGNRKQKDRREVRHSTKKPWNQKGTGRARAGMTSSPLWRGGGKTFPNSPDENFSQKVNRKMYRAGIAAILSQLVREDRLSIVESIGVAAPKTRELVNKLKGMGMGTAHDNTVLIVTDNVDDNLYLAARNLANAAVVEAQHADPVSLVRFRKVLMTVAAVKHLEESLV